MITAKNRDMNRSRDVAGPQLERSYADKETPMKKDMSSDLFHDDAPTGMISKHELSELHYGEYEVPLAAAGMQQVVVEAAMGQDHPDYTPVLAKGPTKDQSHFGMKDTKSGDYSEVSASTGSKKK